MKVIRRTILEKILAEIEKDKEDIDRIELTLKEFEQLLDCLYYDWSINRGEFLCSALKTTSVGYIEVSIFVNAIYNDMSGSYVVIDGVCIQTHK